MQLLDKRWRRRAIGIVSGSTSDTAQPLLAPTFYLARALGPFADARLGDRGVAPQQAVAQFLEENRRAVQGWLRADRAYVTS